MSGGLVTADGGVLRDVERLRRQRSDDALCEAKAAGGGLPKDIWETVSAFANTRGGRILLGVSEAGGFVPAEGFDPQRVIDQFVSGMGDGGQPPQLTNPPVYTIERAELEGRPVVAVDIAENDLGRKPCWRTAQGIEKGSYKRVDDKDLHLSSAEIYEMRHALTQSSVDLSAVPRASLKDLDESQLHALLQRRASSVALRGTVDHGERLRRLNILTEDASVTLAGLLSLGVYPQQFFPRLLVDVTVHPGLAKATGGGRVRFSDRQQCEGALPEVVQTAVAATARHLQRYATVEGSGRTEHLEIPEDVLREAIANAVVHREYADLFQGEPVTVDVYPDRVEIASPGGLWGGKTKDNLDDGRSMCRNRVLMQMLQHVPHHEAAGFTVEGQGGGVRMMMNQMTAHALEGPEFTVHPDQVVVTLRRHGVEIPALRQWLQSLSSETLTEQEEAILLIARRNGGVTVPGLRQSLGADSDVLRMVLDGLASKGLMRETGTDSYALWAEEQGLTDAEQSVVDALASGHAQELSVHDVARATGRAVTSLRPVLRGLVERGVVVATAPPTSRNRRYVLPDG
ncbi:ATP-binding protein [Micrococcus lylae]|uniref:Transcriptional regulator n=2 Tax=Micrococcus lylae TaxID=1273 RepID=A0ABY2K192_9MICC|nr:ATP-binding protein [Micrococcus lylae]TFH98460.1 transcriptional regulator [Micrococcus lylae]